ncbi:MAG: asparagine synthase-related protein [Verrucomicrobiota bacterium]
MPGIAGIIGLPTGAPAREQLDAMVRSMVHEAFYVHGTLPDTLPGVCVGWVNHQGSFADCMPAWNEAHDVCLVFSGEHFADQSDWDALRARGHRVEGPNAAALVHGYEEEGERFFEKLNGWFCGVVIDLRKREALLFNDRYGVSRLYVHESGGAVYFASEAKALLRVLPELRQLDLRSLGEYFSCGCVLQNRTCFQGITQLPGASLWRFAPGQPVRKGFYFQKQDWEKLPLLSAADYERQLGETWDRILPRYFSGNQRAGLSLTGGIDSRLILACLKRPANSLPCYTFGGTYRDCADVTVSRAVAAACGQPHETIPLNGSFFSEFPALAEKAVYLTDGALDVTGSTDLFVHRRVREIGPVRVTGLYGGEVLRSLIVFKPMPQSREHLAPEFDRALNQAAETYAAEKQGHQQSFIAFKQAPWHIYSRLSIERTQVTIRTPYFDNDLVRLAFQAPPEQLNYGPVLRLIASGNPALEAVGTDRALALKAVPGLGSVRHQIQQFTFKAEYAYDYGMPQWLARVDHAFAPFHFEKLWLGRHKYYHFRVWYRDRFADFVKSVLLDPRSLARPYVNPSQLKRVVELHTRGSGNYTLELHRLLTAELMQRQLIEQTA